MDPVARTAMHRLHVDGGARMASVGGWELPEAYAGGEAEARAARAGVGLWDLSASAKWEIRGAGTPEAVQSLLGIPAPEVGRAAKGIMAGKEAMILRLAPDRALAVGPPGLEAEAVQRAVATDGCTHLVNVSSGMAGMRVAGPAARAILATLTSLDVAPSALPELACAETGLARVHAILLRRDLGDLPAFEIYAARNYGAYLWEAFLDVGKTRGLVSCGHESEGLLTAET